MSNSKLDSLIYQTDFNFSKMRESKRPLRLFLRCAPFAHVYNPRYYAATTPNCCRHFPCHAVGMHFGGSCLNCYRFLFIRRYFRPSIGYITGCRPAAKLAALGIIRFAVTQQKKRKPPDLLLRVPTSGILAVRDARKSVAVEQIGPFLPVLAPLPAIDATNQQLLPTLAI